jgi:hypothetical protein
MTRSQRLHFVVQAKGLKLPEAIAYQNCSFENCRLAVIEKKIYSTIATNGLLHSLSRNSPQSTSLIPHGCDDYIRDWNGCCQYGSIEAARARARVACKERFMNIQINAPIEPRARYDCRSALVCFAIVPARQILQRNCRAATGKTRSGLARLQR